jgi:autoinducer 2-degrading protein
MLIVHVNVHVKAECVDAFKAATLANARLSRLEPGVLRFEAIQQTDDPTKFVLIEHYRDVAANAAHKESAHYPVWRDTVAPMMAEPRSRVEYNDVSSDSTSHLKPSQG